MKALAGIRVIDFTHMLSGPYCTQLLADSGAEVIKIEPPGAGEATRKLLAGDPEHSIEGMGAYFLTLGRNKKSVTLDLKTETGRELLHGLVKEADVLVYNFRAGVGEKLGLRYDQLKDVNPRIITCSISGFGETGPNARNTAFDLVAQGAGGGMSLTGYGDEPLRSGIPTGDLGGGMMGTIGILSALQARHSTGRGQHVDISMQDAQVSMLNYMATMFFLSGQQPPAIGNEHFVHVPYGTFPASDGHIILAIITDPPWQRLMEAVDLPALDTEENRGQPGRWKNKEKIKAELAARLETRPKAHWLKLFSAAGIPCAPVNDLADALADPHILARKMVVPVAHPSGKTVSQVGHPVKLSETYEDSFAPPPLVGQHNDEILGGWLGLNTDELAGLKSQGVIS